MGILRWYVLQWSIDVITVIIIRSAFFCRKRSKEKKRFTNTFCYTVHTSSPYWVLPVCEIVLTKWTLPGHKDKIDIAPVSCYTQTCNVCFMYWGQPLRSWLHRTAQDLWKVRTRESQNSFCTQTEKHWCYQDIDAVDKQRTEKIMKHVPSTHTHTLKCTRVNTWRT